MTFTTAYYVYIWDSPSILSAGVRDNTSTASWMLCMWRRQTTICTITIVWHRLDKVLGTIYWSSVLYINDRQMCALTFAARGSVVRLVLLYQAPCFLLLWWVPLYWLLIFVQYGEVDNLTIGGKNLSWSNLIIVVQICAVVTKNVSGTKMIIFDNCERSREKGGLWAEECTRKESATHLVMRSCCFVRQHCFWYRRCSALFENECSISWHKMNMIWINDWVLIQTCGVALVTGVQM
jgi:hypothetical protein